MSTLYLTAASVAFMIPGIVRTKSAALFFGVSGIAEFGQVSQIQTLLISLGGAGLVTATRVLLARVGMSEGQRRSVQSWLFYVPGGLALLFAAPVVIFAPFVSYLVLGSSDFSASVTAGAIGLPLAVMGQVAIAAAQGRRDNRRLLAAAIAAALVGGVSAFLLMSTGIRWVGNLSFVASPMIQVVAVIMICRSVRSSLAVFPRVDRKEFSEIGMIAWASALLGGMAAGADLIARSVLVHLHGLAALSTYLPVSMFVVQLIGMILSALATSAMVELAQQRSARAISTILHHSVLRLVPAVGVASCGVLALCPLLIQLFYTQAIVPSALPLLALALSGESLRACAWIVGSVYLPHGHRQFWLWSGITIVLVQFIIGVTLIPLLGALALAIGLVGSNIFAVVLHAFLLSRLSIRLHLVIWLLPVAVALTVFCSYLVTQGLPFFVLIGPLVVTAASAPFAIRLLFARGRELHELKGEG